MGTFEEEKSLFYGSWRERAPCGAAGSISLCRRPHILHVIFPQPSWNVGLSATIDYFLCELIKNVELFSFNPIN